jgi:ribulose kinase
VTDSLLLALVAGGSAVFGSLVTGWFTYISAVKQRKADRYKRQLTQTYKDIAAYHRLEERYTKALETADRSAESWKKATRKLLRDEGHQSPSNDATAARAEQRLAELT